MSTINSALEGKYKIVGLPDGITKVAIAKFGEVDFSTLTLTQANAMHAMGCKHLEKVEEDNKPKAKTVAKKQASTDG